MLPLLPALLVAASLSAQIPHFPGLETGPHAIGFRAIETEDASRTERIVVDERGRITARIPRRIRIGVWYPAKPRANAATMRYRDYLALVGPGGDRQLRAALAFAARGEVPEEKMQALLATDAAAVRDLPPTRGRFPLIMTDLGVFNVADAEALASHGYVVAGVLFTDYLLMARPMPDTLERVARDLAFATARMKQEPNVDPARVGVKLFSASVAAATLLQFREQPFDAVVSWEGWDGFDYGESLFRSSDGNPIHDRAPRLQIFGGTDELRSHRSSRFFESLRYATRVAVEMKALGHRDFSATAVLLAPENRARSEGYAETVRLTRLFFDATLRGRTAAFDAVTLDPSFATITRRAALTPPPPQQELIAMTETASGVRALQELYERMRAADPDLRLFPEVLANTLGYRALAEQRVADAVVILRMNAEAYPQSANAQDSLREALAALEQTKR